MVAMPFALAVAAVLIQQRADPSFDAKVEKPAFTALHPVVLFDEGHNNVHRLRDRFKPFQDLLANDGYDIRPNSGRLTPQGLKDCRILVIFNARGAGRGFGDHILSAFDAEEIACVKGWVEAGGSLMLVADHAPMGGANANLAGAFGFKMSGGYVEDLQHTLEGPEGDQGGTIVFSRENRLLQNHWIASGRSKKERLSVVYSFTGQAVQGPPKSSTILKLAPTAADRPARLLPPEPGDPPGRSRIEIGEPVPLNGWAQLAAASIGKGRIVVGGEAGMFSAQVDTLADGTRFKFGMNRPGIDNRQLLLNTLHWLSWLDTRPRTSCPILPN